MCNGVDRIPCSQICTIQFLDPFQNYCKNRNLLLRDHTIPHQLQKLFCLTQSFYLEVSTTYLPAIFPSCLNSDHHHRTQRRTQARSRHRARSPTMSTTTAYPEFFRHRTIGRAPSPPTWACYEQIPYDDDYSDSGSEENSCSEDEEDYGRAVRPDSDSDGDSAGVRRHTGDQEPHANGDMEIDEGDDAVSEERLAEYKKDVKGKQRATESEHDSPKRQQRKKNRQPVIALRPILTIQRSQGFVWNQDLFVPPYIKDRYVASTSPPNAKGFVSSSVSSTASGLDYEVEVVEIRVGEGELKDIIP